MSGVSWVIEIKLSRYFQDEFVLLKLNAHVLDLKFLNLKFLFFLAIHLFFIPCWISLHSNSKFYYSKLQLSSDVTPWEFFLSIQHPVIPTITINFFTSISLFPFQKLLSLWLKFFVAKLKLLITSDNDYQHTLPNLKEMNDILITLDY